LRGEENENAVGRGGQRLNKDPTVAKKRILTKAENQGQSAAAKGGDERKKKGQIQCFGR